MKEAAKHVPIQLPSEFTRVGFLFAGITSSDTGLQATMVNIKSNADLASETNKRHHFKLTANYLQPFCPVLKKFSSGTRSDAIKISDQAHVGNFLTLASKENVSSKNVLKKNTDFTCGIAIGIGIQVV
eukprot:9579779-Ditylum_brightwellii.AAC.1